MDDATTDTAVDPFSAAHCTSVAEVPGLWVRRVALAANQPVAWFRSLRATALFFAHRSGLAVQIQRPPFRCMLEAGEFYSVPPGVDLSVYAVDGAPIEFTVFEHGEGLERRASAAPTLAHVGEPTRRARVEPAAAVHTHADTARLVPGLARMDVIASPPELRLIVQGHGVDECVPWHSHDRIADTFYCVSGVARVAVRDPEEGARVMAPGEVYTVPAGVPHMVSGNAGQPCELLILQGVGVYNYVPR
ncbi:cupin domain-containing protein [Variovorax sp. UC122_21]|uniref:cupin domain-containing protein n=1 Tax=Variovorax sp. UC122_21 TaxID=3374554 RepID=UPI0037568309